MKTQYNKIARLAAPALCAVILSGCADSFLKPDPLSFFEPATTFSTESGLRAAMAYSDKHMRRYWFSENTNNIPFFTDQVFGDMIIYGKTDAGSGFRADFAGNLTPTSWMETGFNDGTIIGWMWNDTWDHVKSANTVLNYVDQAEGLDEDVRNEYKGRAYFHRAWAYYNLSFWFGNLPLVTQLPTTPKQDYKSTPIAEIMKMLCHDLKLAVEWVPSQKDMTYYGMINKEACRHLYVKCLLAAGDFKEAENQATILIEQSGKALMRSTFGQDLNTKATQTWNVTRNVIWDLHRPENKMIAANTECILGLPNISEESFQSYPVLRVVGPNVIGNNRTITPDNKGIAQERNNMAFNSDKYDAQADWLHALGRGIGVFRPTFWSQHLLWNDPVTGKEDCQDLRHNHEVGNWVRMEDQTYNQPGSAYHGKKLMLYAPEDVTNKRGQVVLHKGDILCEDTIRGWYDEPLYKLYYVDQKALETEGSNDFQGASLGANGNHYLFRLAETYLLRAEARLYQGNVGGATADVNEIRKRANAQNLYTTVNIGDIMNERARELYMEEFRKVELTRVSMILAMTGIADEWGNTYSLDNWDKQSGTDAAGGSYWYQRLIHYSLYNKGEISVPGLLINYRMDKHNLFWPIPHNAIIGNTKGQLYQNYGYDGYDPSIEMWSTWQEADEAARQ